MSEPFRQRFSEFGLRIAGRSFEGFDGRRLWYADWREPGDESRKGLRYLLDLQTGEWRSFDQGEPFRPFGRFESPSIELLAAAARPADPAPRSADEPDRPADEAVRPVEPSTPAAAASTSFGLPPAQEAWLQECIAAGFVDVDPSPSIVSGFDTGNRHATYRGIRELLSTRTQRILGMFCRKWTLAEYLAMRAGEPVDQGEADAVEDPPFEPTTRSESTRQELARLIMERPFLTPMPTAPLPSVQKCLFA